VIDILIVYFLLTFTNISIVGYVEQSFFVSESLALCESSSVESDSEVGTGACVHVFDKVPDSPPFCP
jgi:hypothetical protein